MTREDAISAAPDVMRPGELMRRLGYKKSHFCRLQQMGRFRYLEHPIGRELGVRRYHRKKVEAALDGQFPALARKRA